MNWVVTLGHFDIAYAVNTLARYNAAPREGHLHAAMRVFGLSSSSCHKPTMDDFSQPTRGFLCWRDVHYFVKRVNIFVGLLLVLIAIVLLAVALTGGIVLFGISFVFLGTLSLSIPEE